MARKKVATGTETKTGATEKQLKNQIDFLLRELSLSKEKADNILRQIGGLRAHCQQNDVPKNEVIRLIDRIIQNS